MSFALLKQRRVCSVYVKIHATLTTAYGTIIILTEFIVYEIKKRKNNNNGKSNGNDDTAQHKALHHAIIESIKNHVFHMHKLY